MLHIPKSIALITIFTCLSTLHISCSSKKAKSVTSKKGLNISSTYLPYSTALGKGKGIIFRVSIETNDTSAIDSFFVRGKSIPFVVTYKQNAAFIEANYLVNIPEPSIGNDAPSHTITDPIITKNEFYPSWLIIKQHNKTKTITIENYTEQKP